MRLSTGITVRVKADGTKTVTANVPEDPKAVIDSQDYNTPYIRSRKRVGTFAHRFYGDPKKRMVLSTYDSTDYARVFV